MNRRISISFIDALKQTSLKKGMEYSSMDRTGIGGCRLEDKPWVIWRTDTNWQEERQPVYRADTKKKGGNDERYQNVFDGSDGNSVNH
jgi:hypothetical protein